MRILCVQTYPGATEAVKRHFPHYEKSGADRVIGITTEGGICYWPTDDVKAIGPNGYAQLGHLPNRLLRTLEYALSQGADEIIVAEYDALFFQPISSPFPDGLVMNKTGGGSPGFIGSGFFHPPWMMSAPTARRVIEVGDDLLRRGMIEQGFPDRFIGLVADQGIPVIQNFFRSYSRNTLDQPQYLEEARLARESGAHVIHGFKTAAQLAHVAGRSFAIVVGSYVGSPWLADCLASLPKDVPVIVVCEHGYECGKIGWAYRHMDLDEFLFLPDTVVVKKHDWIYEARDTIGSVSVNQEPAIFGSFMGKYRRETLAKVDVPTTPDKRSAVNAEAEWTRKYAAAEVFRPIKVLFPALAVGGTPARIEERHGRPNSVLENDSLIKWKGTWNGCMIDAAEARDAVLAGRP